MYYLRSRLVDSMNMFLFGKDGVNDLIKEWAAKNKVNIQENCPEKYND
jgi:hypothetical protein